MVSMDRSARHAWRLVPFVIVAFSAGPAEAAKIACVGDSITYGYGLSNRTQECYPAVLQTLLGAKHTVQNFGATGCTLLKSGDKPYWNDTNFSASNAFKPDVVVIMLGTNDAKPQNWAHKSEFESDYDSLIGNYVGLGAKVYVATPPPVIAPGAYDIAPDVLNNEVVPLIRTIAASESVPLIDVFQSLSGKASDFPDDVHPNADGAKLIAQAVATALEVGVLAGTGGSTGTGGMGAGGVTGTGGSARNTGGVLAGTGGSTGSGGMGAGGVTGTGGSTRNTGGVLAGTGGSTGSGGMGAGGVTGMGGSARNTGGVLAGTGGISGAGGSSRDRGGTEAGGAAGSSGVSGSGGAAKATGGEPVPGSGGNVTGGGGVAGAGGQMAPGGQPGSGGAIKVTGGGPVAGSGASGGSAGSSGTPIHPPAKNGGCGCHLAGKASASQGAYLVALGWLAARVRRRQRRGP